MSRKIGESWSECSKPWSMTRLMTKTVIKIATKTGTEFCKNPFTILRAWLRYNGMYKMPDNIPHTALHL